MKKIVLAYSGGLDTSVMVRWLIETTKAEVIAFIADLGQEEDLEAARQKAIDTGASKAAVADLKEEFARDFLFPILRMNAVYEGAYLLGTSIARPLIAMRQVEVARKEKADALSHGATGKGNDQVRFELTYQALGPEFAVIAPWREWTFGGRGELVAYATKHKIPIPVTKERPYSSDRNLFHLSFEGGILEDPWKEPPADMFVMTADPLKTPDKPEIVEIEYLEGNPVGVNGKRLSPAELIKTLNVMAGRHGIGRVDLVENRFVGIKSRGVYETPGGTVLHVAHRGVESLTLDREVLHLRDSWIPKYAELVYYGFWYAPEREMIQEAADRIQKDVTGTARVKLYKGQCTLTGRKAPKSLYKPSLASFESTRGYNQADAGGFIRLNGLRLSK